MTPGQEGPGGSPPQTAEGPLGDEEVDALPHADAFEPPPEPEVPDAEGEAPPVEDAPPHSVLYWIVYPFRMLLLGLRYAFIGKKGQSRPLWVEIPALIVIALLLTLVVKTFFVQAFYIPSGSMQNTIYPDERVVVDKLSPWFDSQPSRGEVVVFHDPGGWLNDVPAPSGGNVVTNGIKGFLTAVGVMPSSSEKDLIKRVIGLPGDKVACCDAQGRLTVNGTPLDDAGYVTFQNQMAPPVQDRHCPASVPPTAPIAALRCFSVTVPPGNLWVEGDNRYNSCDSVCHIDDPSVTTPFVPESDVVGHALFVIWPLDRIRTLGVPATFDQAFSASGSSPTLPATAGFTMAVPIALARRRRSAAPALAGGICGPGSARWRERRLRRAVRGRRRSP